jgi:hypothetical protein
MRRAVLLSWSPNLGAGVRASRLVACAAIAAAVLPAEAWAWPLTGATTSELRQPSATDPTAPAEAVPATAPATTTTTTTTTTTSAVPTAAEPAVVAEPSASVPTQDADQPVPPSEVPTGEKSTAVKIAADEPAGTAAEKKAGIEASLAFHGALEAYYAYNFNRPSNDYTNWRWYDHRHNMLGVQGLWFAPEWQIGPVSGHFQLQLGVLAELFWASERNVEEDLLWRLLQEATMEWKTPWRRLSLEGGIFNVPFGPEWNLVSKNWNWSTSNLFALMPYQLAGFRLNLDLGKGWLARVGIYNGWDRIVKDNNKQKAAMVAIEWTDPDDEENYFVAEWMVGNERDTGDERGRAPRHVFDVYGQWHIVQPFTLRLHTFSGFEARQGVYDGWLGLAAFAKVDILSWFAIAARGDYVGVYARTENLMFSDYLEDPKLSTAMGSGTLTLDFHPDRNVSLRLEARHDVATFPLFYRGSVQLTDPADPISYITNARTQTTVLAGMTTWF